MSKSQSIINYWAYNSYVSRVPEVEPANSFSINTYPQDSKVIHKQQSYPQGVGGYPQGKTKAPTGVKRSPYMYNTPTQKIYAKVKCPSLYTYF